MVQITSIPTLLAFSRQEAQLKTKLSSVDEMRDRDFLRLWIEDEAMRGGGGRDGGWQWVFWGIVWVWEDVILAVSEGHGWDGIVWDIRVYIIMIAFVCDPKRHVECALLVNACSV